MPEKLVDPNRKDRKWGQALAVVLAVVSGLLLAVIGYGVWKEREFSLLPAIVWLLGGYFLLSALLLPWINRTASPETVLTPEGISVRRPRQHGFYPWNRVRIERRGPQLATTDGGVHYVIAVCLPDVGKQSLIKIAMFPYCDLNAVLLPDKTEVEQFLLLHCGPFARDDRRQSEDICGVVPPADPYRSYRLEFQSTSAAMALWALPLAVAIAVFRYDWRVAGYIVVLTAAVPYLAACESRFWTNLAFSTDGITVTRGKKSWFYPWKEIIRVERLRHATGGRRCLPSTFQHLLVIRLPGYRQPRRQKWKLGYLDAHSVVLPNDSVYYRYLTTFYGPLDADVTKAYNGWERRALHLDENGVYRSPR